MSRETFTEWAKRLSVRDKPPTTPYYDHGGITIWHGDCREVLAEMESESVHCCVTSPPYWGLRDYGTADQIGLEETTEEYVEKMVAVFREVRRVLRDDGTLWLNLGDSYAGGGQGGQGKGGQMVDRSAAKHRCREIRNTARASGASLKPKDLVGIPWRVAFALQADGWYLRQDIIWHKPNPMPESVTDRCTKAHEYVFLLSKAARYWYDAEAIAESCSNNSHGSPNINPGRKQREMGSNQGGRLGMWTEKDKEAGRNRRSVWTVATQPFSGAHFAVFPQKLILPCVLTGCPKGGTILDPFGGAGTTALVARDHGRRAILSEMNQEYCALAARRLAQEVLAL